jgi:hypothetical protein
VADEPALDLARDPIGSPLAYPGRLPATSGLLDGSRFLPLRERPGMPYGRWSLPGGAALDDVLGDRVRHPVLAVGSNGSPAQVRRKLHGRASVLVPMIYVTATGLVSGVSAHVSRPGYVPAAPVLVPGVSGRFVVLWLDADQLAVVDATEPNYRRLPLPAAVSLDADGAGTGCEVYAGRHGCLADRTGRAFRLSGQAELISALLADLPELARLTGASGPEDFAARLGGDESLREQVRILWRREGRVLDQDGV